MGWALDMGQRLSIPFILLGIYMIWAGRDPARNGSGPGAESPGRNA